MDYSKNEFKKGPGDSQPDFSFPSIWLFLASYSPEELASALSNNLKLSLLSKSPLIFLLLAIALLSKKVCNAQNWLQEYCSHSA